MDCINKYKKENRIILASSSIDPVVKQISEKMNADYVSSLLEIKNGKYTGKLKFDILNCKKEYLKSKGIDCNKINIVLSDNYEDLNLIKNANKGIAIIHSLKKSIFWKKNKVKNLLWV